MNLLKVFQAPGLASKSEIDEAVEWLTAFQHDLEIYKSALGEPTGFSVQSRLDTLAYYQQEKS